MDVRHKVIGILGGSFNPVHNGHIMVARYISSHGFVDEVWLTLSPQNPLKNSRLLIDDDDRLAMLRLAVNGTPTLKVCDIELSMPRPSFTIDTLEALSAKHEDCRFKVIIGSDNWQVFDKWRDCQNIIKNFGVIVYPRPGYDVSNINVAGVSFANAPVCEISSTDIRRHIAEGESIDTLVSPKVKQYITEHNLYAV